MSYTNAYEGSLQSDYNPFDHRDSSTFLDNTQEEGYFNGPHGQGGPGENQVLSYRQPDPHNDGVNRQYHVQSNAAPLNEQLTIVDNETHYTSVASSRPAEDLHRMPGRGYPSTSSNRATSSAPLHARRGSDNKFRITKESHLHKEVHPAYPAQDEQSWPIKERNRQAAIRFRSRQREGIARLKSDEQAVEQRHGELCDRVNSLNQEIHCLKMQVLQHTNCNCIPAHHYVEQEAQPYLHSMGPM